MFLLRTSGDFLSLGPFFFGPFGTYFLLFLGFFLANPHFSGMTSVCLLCMGQKENPWGPQVAGSIFPFTNRVFWVVPGIFDPQPFSAPHKTRERCGQAKRLHMKHPLEEPPNTGNLLQNPRKQDTV